jgi:hypothetical protein
MRNLFIGVAIGAIALAFQAEPTYAETPGAKVLTQRLIEAAQRAVNDGYTPITFTDFKVSDQQLAATGQKVMLSVGVYYPSNSGHGGQLNPGLISADGNGFVADNNEVKAIDILLTEETSRETKSQLIEICGIKQCSAIFLGHAEQCTITNVYGRVSNRVCFVPETNYGTQEMVQEAMAANAAPPPLAYQSQRAPIQQTPNYNRPAPPVVPNLGLGPEDSFRRGREDRQSWELWHASLSSDYRTGAEYWAGQRSMPKPGSCSGVPEFTAGCLAAKKFLDPVDAQRKSDPVYKAGWSAPTPLGD